MGEGSVVGRRVRRTMGGRRGYTEPRRNSRCVSSVFSYGRPEGAVNGAIQAARGGPRSVRGRRKQESDRLRCAPRCFCLVWLTSRRKKKQKKNGKKKRKKNTRTKYGATRRERRWDLPAPVPRLPSFDPMIRISRRVGAYIRVFPPHSVSILRVCTRVRVRRERAHGKGKGNAVEQAARSGEGM